MSNWAISDSEDIETIMADPVTAGNNNDLRRSPTKSPRKPRRTSTSTARRKKLQQQEAESQKTTPAQKSTHRLEMSHLPSFLSARYLILHFL